MGDTSIGSSKPFSVKAIDRPIAPTAGILLRLLPVIGLPAQSAASRLSSTLRLDYVFVRKAIAPSGSTGPDRVRGQAGPALAGALIEAQGDRARNGSFVTVM